jgi:magnesium chelatase subunit H
MVYGGRTGPIGTTCKACHKACTFTEKNDQNDMFTCVERTDMLAARIEKLLLYGSLKLSERRVSIVLFNFPPNAGSVGTAAYLGVFQSLYNL